MTVFEAQTDLVPEARLNQGPGLHEHDQSQTVAETKLTRLCYLPGDGDTLFVTFSPLRERLDANTIWADRPLRKIGMPGLGFVAKSDHWYPYQDTSDLIAAASGILSKYKTIVTYGFSMGAYAALKFSALVKANVVVALSPQFSIDTVDLGGEDTRFIRHFNNELNRDMALSTEDIGGQVYVVFDPLLREDAMHVKYIASLASCSLIILPFSGHGTAQFLSRTGVSSKFLRLVMDPITVAPDIRNLLRTGRVNSPDYLSRLSDRLFQRGRTADAERAIAQAIVTAPSNIHLYSRHLNLLMKAGRREEASVVLDKLGALPGESAAQAVRTCQAYELLGHKTEAISRLREAVNTWPREPLLRIQLGNLLSEQHPTDEASKLATEIRLLNSPSWRIWRSLALLHHRLREYELATKAMQHAVELNPKDTELRISVIDLFIRCELSKGAEDHINLLKQEFILSDKEKAKLSALEQRLSKLSTL